MWNNQITIKHNRTKENNKDGGKRSDKNNKEF